MDVAPWGRPGRSGDWAQDALIHVTRLLPTPQTSFQPVSSEQTFSEIPGAQLPSGSELFLWTDSSASGDAAASFRESRLSF